MEDEEENEDETLRLLFDPSDTAQHEFVPRTTPSSTVQHQSQRGIFLAGAEREEVVDKELQGMVAACESPKSNAGKEKAKLEWLYRW